jgi:hypothetical protein
MYLARNGVIGRPRGCLGGVKIASTSLSARPVARFMSETDAIKSSVSRPSVTAYRKRTALTAMLTLEADSWRSVMR